MMMMMCSDDWLRIFQDYTRVEDWSDPGGLRSVMGEEWSPDQLINDN